jgi:2-succinyl-6-hydroxy-2,4-cyclohexadiene-1-carboxylate synthase
MQPADTWAQIAARVRRNWDTKLVDLKEPSREASIAAIRGDAVVAYSMGGRLALHTAVRHPAAFRALVLVGATPGIEDPALRRSRQAADEDLASWMEHSTIDAIVEHWEQQPVFATQDAELRAKQRPGRLQHDPAGLAAMLRATGQGTLPSLWDRLHEVTIPVLAVAGEKDAKYAETAQRMADRLPRGRAAIIAGTGHAPQLEQPDLFADLLLEFLDEHFG